MKLKVYLQMAIPNAKFGIGKASGNIGVDLGVYVWIDANHDSSRLANALSCRSYVFQVKFAVHVDEHLLLDCKSQLRWKLAIPVKDCPAVMFAS